MAARWSDLPSDLILSIANYLFLPSDYISFCAVCSSWRSVALKALHQHPSPQFLALVLPDEDHGGSYHSETRFLYNPWEDKIYKNSLRLPHRETVRGSHGSWLLCVDLTLSIHIFNPLSGVRIPLPHLTTIPFQNEQLPDNYSFVTKAAFLKNPSTVSSPQDIVVMLIYEVYGRLAFASPHDEAWTAIDDAVDRLGAYGVSHLYSDVISYKGKFYAANKLQRVVVCDLDGPSPTVRNLISPEISPVDDNYVHDNYVDFSYLVESVTGELLLVNRFRDCDAISDDDSYQFRDYDAISDDDSYQCRNATTSFDVYKLDIDADKRVKVNTLDDQMLFLGVNSSFALPAMDLFGRQLRSCMYFTDNDYEQYSWRPSGGYDAGIFNLEDGKIEPNYPPNVYYISPEPFWFNPLPL